MSFRRFVKSLLRCKRFNDDVDPTPLNKCLTLLELTALGVGSSLGLGLYVLSGSVVRTVAGPAVIISFTIAVVAAGFAGVCYAEFAARIPTAGTACEYSYYSLGELVAFIVGWDLVLKYLVSTATVAKATSSYMDALFNHSMSSTMRRVAPIQVPLMATQPDFFAFSLVALATVILATSTKGSAILNLVLTAINVVTVIIVISAGAIKCDQANWEIKVQEISSQYQSRAGEGGFMPWGVASIMEGSAKCFLWVIGWDCLATTGEEAKYPSRDIPIAIGVTLIIIFFSYFGVVTVLTMMWPYYLQNEKIPLSNAFEKTGMTEIKWIVSAGAISALCANLIGALFPLPRVLYAMSVDGLLCEHLGRINGKTKTPVVATVCSGSIAAMLSTLLDLEQLIELLSVCSLLAYTAVAIGVLVLRFEAATVWPTPSPSLIRRSSKEAVYLPARSPLDPMLQIFNCRRIKEPIDTSASIANISIILVLCFSLALSAVVVYRYSVVAVSSLSMVLVLLLIILYRQPTHGFEDDIFAVPLVPLVPYLSLVINMFLVVQLRALLIWVIFIVWMALGCLIYFAYSIRNSALNRRLSVRISRTILVKDDRGRLRETRTFHKKKLKSLNSRDSI